MATGQDPRDEAIQQARILTALIGLQEVNIILNTFIKAFVRNSVQKASDVWYLHGNFNLGGTVSGRLSCIAGWTQLITKTGYKPIRHLTIKDEVWTHKHRFQPITQLVIKGYDQMYDVRLSNGEVLTCTIDHRVLLSTGQWQSIEEIINVGIENLDTKSRQYFECARTLPEYSINAYGGKNSRTAWLNIPQRICHTLSKFVSRRIQSYQSSEILSIKDGKQKSNEEQNQRTTPQLDRRVRRWIWLSNHITQWEKRICASGKNDESTRLADITGNMVSTPYRQRPNEQRLGQSSSLYKNRAQAYPSLAGRGQSRVEIEEIKYRGRYQVYDISVAKDESYMAASIFSHNSSKPNLQNIPSNAEKRYAKLIKACFISPPGWLFAGVDFDSLEDKISALTTGDPNKLKVYLDHFDGHCLRAFSYFQDEMPGITNDLASINSIKTRYPALRQKSKGPTFLLTYGGTHHGLVNNIGIPPDQAKQIEKNYHDLYQASDKWVQDRLYNATRDGYVTGAFGLRLRTPILQQTILNTRKTPYEAKAEGRTAGNMLGQSYGMLNNRAAIEFQSMVLDSPFAEDILPIAHIHDAQYFLIKNEVGIVEWFNRNLIPCLQWQDLPEIQHDVVKLGGSVDLFWPHWGNPTSIPNDASMEAIMEICDAV